MPSEKHLPNVHILLPLALYVIPLAFMAEYIVQHLWGLIHQSFKAKDLSPPSSPSSLPPPSSLEESGPISSYVTLSPSPFPILPVRMTDKGKQQEETPPKMTSELPPLPLCCLLCQSKEHRIAACPKFAQTPFIIEAHQHCVLF